MHKLSTVALSNGIEMEKKVLNALARYMLTVIKSLAVALMYICTLVLLTNLSIEQIFLIVFAILVYKLEYIGTMNTTSRLDLFRKCIHMFMSICFLPCVYIFEIPLFEALVLHFLSACLESLHNGCALPVFKYGENIDVLHYIIINASVIIGLYSVISDDPVEVILISLLNYMVHCVMFDIKHYVHDRFLQMRNYYIALRDFLKKYGKVRTGIYVTVNLLVSCFVLFWLHFVASHSDKGGFYLLTSKPNNKYVDIHHEIKPHSLYCYPSFYPFKVSEMFYETSNFTYLVNRNTIRKIPDTYNLVVSYFYNDDAYFRHEVHMRQACSNIFFFWKQNGVHINMKHSRKYNFTLTESDEHIRLLLIIYSVKNADLGEYILYEKSICSKNVGEKNVSHDIKTEPVALFCLTRLSKTTVRLRGMVGQVMTISNFAATISNAEKYSIEYLVGERDIEWICPAKMYCTFIQGDHMSNFFAKNVTRITDSLSVVHINVSFCICPDAFTRSDFHSLQLVSNRNRNVISVVQIKLEPTVSELLDRRFAKIFETCERTQSIPKFSLYSCFASHWEFSFLKRILLEDFKEKFAIPKLLLCFSLTIFVMFFPVIVFVNLSNMFLYFVFHSNDSKQSFCKLNAEQKAELDVLLSFDEDCYEDNHLALDVITPFITANKYSISSCTVAEHQGNARVLFENLAMKSKTLIVILSSNYLNNDHCKLQYEYTLLPMIGLSKMSKGDVLIIKTESCPPDTHALVTFKVVDWDNSVNRIRSEEAKKEEIISWIKSRTEEPPFLWKFLVTHINTLYRFIKNIMTI